MHHMKRNTRERLMAYLFSAPALILFAGIVLLPTLMGFGYSLTNWTGITDQIKYIGLKNYERLFQSPVFYAAIKNTFFITVIVVVLQNVLSILLALAMNSPKVSGKGLLKVIYFIPSLLSVVVVCYMWMYILNVHVGLLGTLLRALGVEKIISYDVFIKPVPAMLTIALIMVWQFTGYNMVIYLSSLQSVPVELYESAAVDGAKGCTRFFRITLPMIMPSVTINVFLNLIGCIKMFEQVYILTKGGPGTSTTTIGVFLYNTALSANQFGYGTAISTVLFVIVLIVAVVQVGFMRSKEVSL